MTEQEKQAVETLTRSFTGMETLYKVKCTEVEAREEEISRMKAENAALRERLEKTEHRAEVAEKALKIVAYEIPCDDWCPFSQKCNVELNGENWYQCCFDEYLRQAEEKLTEEGKDENI